MRTAIVRTTSGVLGALELAAPGDGEILPHEHTTKKDKADRLDILRATRTNLSPIWVLSPSAGLGDLCEQGGVELGVGRRRRRRRAPPAPGRGPAPRGRHPSRRSSASPVVIADGHHRYETSTRLPDEPSGASRARARRVDPGPTPSSWPTTSSTVQPIHRLLSGLPAGFDVLAWLAPHFEAQAEHPPIDANLPTALAAAGCLALVLTDGVTLLRPRASTLAAAGADLDSSRLDVALADLPEGASVRYQHGVEHIAAAVAKGEADAGLLLRPATVAQIAETGRGGDRMPPKTTFFWPKPRTGLVFRPLD